MTKNLKPLVLLLLMAVFSCKETAEVKPLKPVESNNNDQLKSARTTFFPTFLYFDGTANPVGKIALIASKEQFTNATVEGAGGWVSYKFALDVWLSPKLAIAWEATGDNNQKWAPIIHSSNPNWVALKSVYYPAGANDGFLQPGGPNGQLKVGPGVYYWYASSSATAQNGGVPYTVIRQLNFQPTLGSGTPSPTSKVLDFNWPWQKGSPITLTEFKVNTTNKNQEWVFISINP